MDRFLNGKCYVQVTGPQWPAFAEMCDKAGVAWGYHGKASAWAPDALHSEGVLLVTVVGGMLCFGSVASAKASGRPVIRFCDLAMPTVIKSPLERFRAGEVLVEARGKDFDELATLMDALGVPWVEGCKWRVMDGGNRACGIFHIDGSDGQGFAQHFGANLQDVIPFAAIRPEAQKILAAAAPAPEPIKAVIIADGRTITARLIADKGTVKTTAAACAPDDTFRFGPGALLAMYRTLETEEDRSLAMNLIAEDRIRQLEPEIPNIRDLVGAPKKNSPEPDMDAIGDLIVKGLEEALKPLGGTLVIRCGTSQSGKSVFRQAVEKSLRDAGLAEGKGK